MASGTKYKFGPPGLRQQDLMPGPEDVQLRDRADGREEGQALRACSLEGLEAAFADVVKVAALEAI